MTNATRHETTVRHERSALFPAGEYRVWCKHPECDWQEKSRTKVDARVRGQRHEQGLNR